MLVEEEDRGKVVQCLICKTPIRVGGEERTAAAQSSQPSGQKPAVRSGF